MKKIFTAKFLLLVLIGIVYFTVTALSIIITGLTKDFFIGFAFLTFSLAATVFVILEFLGKASGTKTVFIGIPIYYLCAIYFGACAVLDFIHMIFGTFSMKLTFIIQIILFAVYAFLYILSLIHASFTKKPKDKKNDFIKNSIYRIAALINVCENEEFDKTLNLLGSEFKNSPRITDERLSKAEHELDEMLTDLELSVKGGEFGEETEALAKRIKHKLADRNNIANSL